MTQEQLQEKCEGDVLAELGPQRFGAQAGAFAGFDIPSLIPGLVKLALDSAVAALGSTVEDLAQSQHDLIRSVVSEKVLQYVERLARGLQDTTPSPA